MDKTQKALKTALSAKCTECGDPCKEGNKYCGKVACRVQAHFRRKIEAPIKAKAAGDSQKSLAREVDSYINRMTYFAERFLSELNQLKALLDELLK